jgi:tyrosinase
MKRTFDRRHVLKTGLGGLAAGLIPFPEWFARYGRAEAAPPMIRSAVDTAAGAAMLAKYSSAVGAMMPLGEGDPCGWAFQWYTHQIRDDRQKSAAIAGLPAAQRPLATDMWNTCQAHSGRPLQYFLPWHRMYVYFLERIVRKACGDPAFTLPYWDYLDSSQRPIPSGFRPSGSNPLYRVDRNNGSPGTADVNAGQPIDLGQPAGTINRDCMGETDYLPSAGSSGFCSKINQNPHGIVHTLIGNTVGMGTVPWAANDPIFWLHHCNIDRIWASWNAWGRPNPAASSWRDKEFVFADENCNRVVVKVGDFEAIAPLGYAYDRLIPSLRLPPRLRDLRLIAVYRDPRPDPGPLRIELAARPVTVRLTSPEGPAALARGLRALRGARSARLVIRDLQAARAPGILYHVYLNLPARSSRTATQAHYVGPITFFDAVVADRAQMEGMDHRAMEGESGPSFDFDVTALLRRLGPIDRLEVTLVPQGRPAQAARASIGNIELSAG